MKNAVYVPVLVVALKDRVYHVDELLVLEDLGLWHLLAAAVVVVRRVCWKGREKYIQLSSIVAMWW